MTPSPSYDSIFARILDALRNDKDVCENAIADWFSTFVLEKITDDTLYIVGTDMIAIQWAEVNYGENFKRAISSVMGKEMKFKLAQSFNGDFSDNEETKAPVKQAKAVGEKLAMKNMSPSRQETPNSTKTAKPSLKAQNPGINPFFTFEQFVSFEECEFARGAALAVAQSKQTLFNPLFLYSKPGLGKTHLLHAIGHEVHKNDPQANVVYVTGEQFTNEFIEASMSKNYTKLRRKYRKADVLLVDDIQFISGKDYTVEEFLHTFDALFNGHKSIVICANKPACEINGLDSRLVSRFESGLTIEIPAPSYEARLSILQNKRTQSQINISDEILEFLAVRIQKSVRRLEGALLRVATFSSLSGITPSLDKIEQLLRDILTEESTRVLSIDTIQKHVASHFELKHSDMTSKRRPNSIAFPRQIAMYLSRKLTNSSLQDIGYAFGGRDHGTVIHANKLIESKMTNDEQLRNTVQKLASALAN